MTTKLFISYRSIDSGKVNKLVAQLRSLKTPEGTPLYDIWQDKTSIKPGEDWWQSIVRGIDSCRVFVFMVSKESAKNANCRAELSYARRRNRPVRHTKLSLTAKGGIIGVIQRWGRGQLWRRSSSATVG